MSQINDALKRAQNAQQNKPPPGGGSQLPPAAPEQAATPGTGLAGAFGFVAIVLVGLLFAWQFRQKRPGQNTVSAKTTQVAAATAAPQKTLQPAVPAQSVSPAPLEKPAARAVVPPAQPVARPVPPPAPAPPPLKLQAVLFSGRNSTAMINGRTVMAGDRVAEYHVFAINERSVTLISAARTNVLTLNP